MAGAGCAAEAGWWRVLRLCWVQSRPVVQVVFLLRFGSAAALAAAEGRAAPADLVPGTLAWVGAVFAVYLVNGVHDAVEDAVNHPGRPIAAGELGVREAGRVAVAGAVFAVACAWLAGPGLVVLTCVFLLVGHLYSVELKRTAVGTSAVVLVGGLATYLAGFLAAGGRDLAVVLVPAVAMSLWMALVGAVAKDFTDVAGDRAARRRTVVIVLGEGRARAVVRVNALLVGAGYAVTAAVVVPVLVLSAAATLTGAVVLAVGDGSVGFGYRVYMRTQLIALLLAFGVLAVGVVPP
jgi:4-hydroxybenzoate polyprenyltransferase